MDTFLAFASPVVGLLGLSLMAILLVDFWHAKAVGVPSLLELLSLFLQLDDADQVEELATLRGRLKAQKERKVKR